MLEHQRHEIEVIGFDLDNTLYPSTEEIQARIRGDIYIRLSSLLGIDVRLARKKFEEAYSLLGAGSRAVEKLGVEFGKPINGSDFIQEAITTANILDMINPNPDLVKMVKRLSTRRKIDLLTSSKYSSALDKLLRIGLSYRSFDYILTGENNSKSDGTIYKHWIKVREVAPRKMLYVGDNHKQDIIVPKSLGIKTCIIGECDEADFRISNILDLEKLFD